VLVTENPDPVVMDDRLTANPFVLRFAVPELLVAAVAVQLAATMTFAIAPEFTVSISAPPVPKSVMESVPVAL